MNKIATSILLIASMFLLVSEACFAQPEGMVRWRGSGGWGGGTAYNRMYNPQTIETIEGEVISIDRITPMGGMSNGVHLLVRSGKETISVHLGPQWYLENQDIEIKPKDKVKITGSRITFSGKPAIVASQVTKGDTILTLRDKNGFPLWSGCCRSF
jgi:hypothetical protein